MKTLFIACDHAAVELKEKVKLQLQKEYLVTDLGTNSSESVDYPDYADKLCNELLKNKDAQGILICGSGQGMAIRANKFKHIRAALCWSEEVAKLSREHNSANVLCLGARVTSEELNLKIVKTFLTTDFLGGRHEQRVKKLCL